MSEPMFRAPRLSVFATAMLLVALGAGAQETPAPGVAVEAVNSRITLRVTQPSDLHAILEALCQRTQTRCDLAPELAQTTVEPTTISGTWKEVVTQLLEGESLNYANLGAGPSGRLVVQARRAAAPESRTKSGEEEGKGAERRAASSKMSADSGDQEEIERQKPEQETGDGASRPPSPMSEVERMGSQAGFGAGGSERGGSPGSETPGMSSQEHQAREAAVWGIITGRTPIPSAPTAPPGMVALPVPDQNGNPIFVPSTGQGLTAGPFPGPNGQPLPITPGAPGPITNPFGIPSQPRP